MNKSSLYVIPTGSLKPVGIFLCHVAGKITSNASFCIAPKLMGTGLRDVLTQYLQYFPRQRHRNCLLLRP